MFFSRNFWNRQFTVRTVGWATMVVALLGFSAFAVSSSFLLWRSDQSIGIWGAYKTINDDKRRSFDELVEHLGYGGFIHGYKNYILRKDNKLVSEIDSVLGSAVGAIDRYRLSNISARERRALGQISKTMAAYGVQLHQIQKLILDNSEANLIDTAVRVDDRPALRALLVLKNITAHGEKLSSGDTRLGLIGELRFALGYGGMIHNFKNYVLRRDKAFIARMNEKVDKARQVIQRYRRLKLSAGEQNALRTIEIMLGSYQAKVAAMMTRSAAAYISPEALDDVAKVNDRLALRALKALDKYAARHVESEARTLDEDLATVKNIAIGGVVIAVVMGLLVLAAIYFAMAFIRRNLMTLERLAEDLSVSEVRLNEAQKVAGIGNWEYVFARNTLNWSDEVYRILGLNREETEANYDLFKKFIHPDDRQIFKDVFQQGLISKEPYEINFRGVLADGEIRYYHENGNIEFGADDKPVRMFGTIQDVTEQKKRETELQLTKDKVERLAYLDELTGLSNRTRCQADLTTRFLELTDESEFAMIHIDIDNFKRVNDSLGHLAGDKLLKEIGSRMKLLAEESGFAKAYRWGGDEFVVLADCSQEDALVAFCEELTDLIGIPIQDGETTIWTTASVGVARYPQDGSDLKSLMIYSDLAMYKSKEMGRDCFQFFTKEMKVKIDEETRIEEELRKAIEKDELFLVFQPQLDVATQEVRGVEALLRWKHPERGVLAPGSFLSVIENTSLAPQVGQIVIHKALEAARKWLDEGHDFGRMGLNISPKHLRLGNFLSDLQGEMELLNISPEHLAVEVLESIFLDDPDVDTFGVLETLHNDGVHVQLDDFGTGYASLSHLSSLPVDTIKIDRSFTMEMEKDEKKAVVVKALVNLARILDIGAICEGVENAEQLDMLKEIGHCSTQGYYLCRPIGFEDMTDWLRDQPKLVDQAALVKKAS